MHVHTSLDDKTAWNCSTFHDTSMRQTGMVAEDRKIRNLRQRQKKQGLDPSSTLPEYIDPLTSEKNFMASNREKVASLRRDPNKAEGAPTGGRCSSYEQAASTHVRCGDGSYLPSSLCGSVRPLARPLARVFIFIFIFTIRAQRQWCRFARLTSHPPNYPTSTACFDSPKPPKRGPTRPPNFTFHFSIARDGKPTETK